MALALLWPACHGGNSVTARAIPSFVEEAKDYVRSHGGSGRKRHERSIRVDPRHLVVNADRDRLYFKVIEEG